MSGKTEASIFQKYMAPSLALIMALVTGFGFSGSILVAGALLKSSITFMSASIFQTILMTLFTINILTQASTQYQGMKNLLSGMKTSPDQKVKNHLNAISDTAQAYRNTSLEDTESNEFLGFLKQKYKLEIMQLENELSRPNIEDDSFACKVRNLLEMIPGITFVADYLNGTRSKKNRLSYLKDLVDCIQANLVMGLTKKENEELFTVFKQSVEFDIPQPPATSFSETLFGALQTIVYIITLINAWTINSLGFVIFGALSFIQLVGINTLPMQYGIALCFYFIGAISSLSFSGPAVISTIKTLFGYDKKANEVLRKARKNSKSSGFLNLPSSVQTLLAFFLAAGIAVSNMIANIAFGEFIFAGASLFDPSMVSTLMANPFAATPYSIALGILGGGCTSILLTLLFISGTLAVSPEIIERQEKQGSSLTNWVYNKVSFCVKCASAFIASAFVFCITTGRKALPFIKSHASMIMIAVLTMLGIYQSYTQCSDDNATTVSNLFVTVTLLTTTFVTLYLSLLPGSLFFQIMPPTAAKICAFITALANAELTLPIFKNYATPNIDACINTTKSKFGTYTPKTDSAHGLFSSLSSLVGF